MQLLNEREQVKRAIRNWINAYGYDGSYEADTRNCSVGRSLAALNSNYATAEDVAKIIGNSWWATEVECDECGNTSWDVVEFGERQAHMCLSCLQQALTLFNIKKG